MCALWKQSLSSLAEKHAQWKFNQVLQVLCKVLPTLLQHSSGYCNRCFAWEAHRFSGAQRVPLTSKPQLTAQHSDQSRKHCPNHSTGLAWAFCTAATACHWGCEHDLGCFTAQSIWSMYFCQPHICRKEGDPKLPWNVFRNGEEAFIVNFSCLGIVPKSVWRQIIDLSRLRLDLNWKQLLDNENIYQKYFTDYWHFKNHINLPQTFRWNISQDVTFSNQKRFDFNLKNLSLWWYFTPSCL